MTEDAVEKLRLHLRRARNIMRVITVVLFAPLIGVVVLIGMVGLQTWVLLALLMPALLAISAAMSHTCFLSRYYRGVCRYLSGDLAKAADTFEGFLQQPFSHGKRAWLGCHWLSIIKYEQLDFSGAAGCARKALEYAEKRPDYRKFSLVRLHASLVRAGSLKEAEGVLAEIRRFPADPSDFLHGIIMAYTPIMNGRPEDALAHIEPFAGRESYSSCTFNAEMAIALTAHGRESEAKQYLEKARQAPKDKIDTCLKLYPALASVLEVKPGDAV